MNTQCFRVIFSRTLQRLVVVSELAKSAGKAESEGTTSSAILPKICQIRPLAFSLFCALGFVAFSDNALAETLIIQADPSAPKNQQPIILQTANGLPQINIQTPNDKGLSHNKYSQFDVAEKGAILNNSRTNTATQQAGMVQGNPYLARGEAKVILNEVNSGKPSVMKGYVEVAGKKAEVIIANPSGLHCDGCGIINADRATLTTGKPQINQGNLDGFVVEKGKVTVAGKGLDNSRVDYTDILAREAKINAGVWSKKETKVITGKNTVKRSNPDKHLQIIHTNQPLAGEEKPTVAIDVGELGGMYAGKIHLIGTEQGMGVRNAGHIGASADTLTIDSQGRIVNSGTLNAQQAVQLNAQHGIDNQGKIENKQGDIQLNSKADIQNSGSIVARSGNIQKKADTKIQQSGETVAKGNITYTARQIHADKNSLIAAGVDITDTAQGEVRKLEAQSATGKTIQLTAPEKTTAQGKNIASGKVNIQGSEINLDNSHTAAYSLNVDAHQGNIQANNAALIADNSLSLRTPSELQTQQSHIKAGKITTEQRSLNTQNAVWEQTGTDELKISVKDQLKNPGGTFKTQGDFTLRSQGVDNRQGRLIAAGKFTLDAGVEKVFSAKGKIRGDSMLIINSGELDNEQGAIQSKGDIRLNTQGQALINQNTLSNETGIVALGALDISTAKLNNQNGYIVSRGKQSLQATELNNQEGLVQSQQTLAITTPVLHNDKGTVFASYLALSANSLSNRFGLLQSTDRFSLNAAQVENSNGAILGGKALNLNVSGSITQNTGNIGAATLDVNAEALHSAENSVITADNATLNIKNALTNTHSEISTTENLAIHSKALDNQSGLLFAEKGNLTIDNYAQPINNRQGKMVAGKVLHINSGELNNQHGLIQSRQAMQINTHQGNLNNQQTQKTDALLPQQQGIISLGQLVITTQQLLNQQGYVLSQENQTINAQNIENNAGVLSSLAEQQISAEQGIQNSNGRISGQQTDITAKVIHNREGQIRATDGALRLNSSTAIDNKQGTLSAAHSAQINADSLNNQHGLLYNEQGTLSLKLQQVLDNRQGKLISQDTLKVESDSLLNQQGTIYAQTQAAIQSTSHIDNQQHGKIHGLGNIQLQTERLDNRGGEIRTQHNLTLNATSAIDNQKVNESGSLIESGNALNINTAQLNNSHTGSSAETMTQGILTSALTLSAQTLNNQQGKIHSRTQSELNVAQRIDNRQGEITGDQHMHIQGQALLLDNQAGRLQAGGKLSLFANEITTNGHIEGRDIELNQRRDFVTDKHIHAKQTLSITTPGNVLNQHQLYADERVTLNANRITNGVDGRISSANTQLVAQTDVHNEGLINSISPTDNAETLIKAAGQIINTGTGRIYGDHIALQADRLENSDKDYGNGNIKSAVIAARGAIDIAAREVENNTAHYLTDNQVGATLFSVGDIRFGRTLNSEHQAEGQAEVLRNNSSIIEAQGHIQLNVANIKNNNRHFAVEHVKTGQAVTNITKLVSRPVSETYIVPMGRDERHNLKTDFTNDLNGDKSSINKNDPHIPMKLLRWAGWSRAGQLVYKNDGAEPTVLKPGDVITPDTPLAMRNEVHCDYIAGKESCGYAAAGQYGADSPIWAYFGATPPTTPQPKFPFDDLSEQPWFVESEWFDEDGTFKRPSQPFRFSGSARYQAQKVKWDYYVEHIKPLEDWERDNADSINKVDAGIEKHNRDRLGDLADKYYRDFWRLHISNHRTDESKVTQTVPAQILAGGHIDFESSSFTNDKSVVIAGQHIALKDQIHNIDEKGRHRITETGDKVFTFDKWRGGFKRYFQRKWENHGAYTRIIETPFDMQLFRVDENINYDEQKRTPNHYKIATTHDLSLSTLHVEGEAFSAQSKQALGAQDNAQFVNVNRANGTEPTQGQAASARPLYRIELNNETEIRTIQPNIAIPQNALYKLNPSPNSHVLIETDPDFTNQKRWLSSDYMFNALRVEPNFVQKRLGDGFVEQRSVREQINRLTGRQFLGGYTDFDSQYKALMDAGITFAQKFNLRLGIALSPEQMASLTSDIVWLENQSVRLPNGKTATVLVPKVYAMVKKDDVTGNGTLLSGNTLTHKGGEFINNGTVLGRELVRFDSESIRNSGKVSAGVLAGNVSGNLDNIGGTLEADRAVLLNVVGNFTHRSTTHTTEVNEAGYARLDTTLGRKGLLHVKGKDGALQINANNIEISGADIINDGQGQTYLSAKNQLNLTALQVGFDEKMGGGNHYRNEALNDVLISRVQGNGDVVVSGKNLYSEGADFDAKARLALLAENDMVLGSAIRSRDYEEYHKTKSGNALAKKTKTTYDHISETEHKGTELTGESILVKAGHDIQGESLLAVSRRGDIDFIAGNNVTLSSATNQLAEQHIRETKRNGFLNDGGLAVTIGSQKTRQENTLDGAIQSTARNTLGSEGGNIRIQAGNKASVSNVDVLISNEKTAVISGKNGVRIESGKDVINSTDNYEFSQSGLSIALSTPVTDAVQSARQSVQKAKATQNEKLKGVYAMKAAEDAVIAAQNAQKVADTLSKLGDTLSENTAAAENPAMKVSVSVGTQKQELESRTTGVTHSKSNLNGGNIALISEEGKVELEGVDTQVKDTLLLDGKLGIESKGVADSYRNQTKEKNHSVSVGVFMGFNGNSYGIGLEASGSVGKGKENSESQTWQNNQLQAGKIVTNSANGKLLLDATNVKANRWEGEVQDFEAKSRQDITKYSSEQVQAGGSASLALGISSANVNAAYNSAKLNTAQVENQTAIDIDKGGMDVKVKKNAHFDGAVMTSQAEQENNRFQAGTLSTSDIENHSELKTRSAAISGGTSGVNPMSALSLLGNKNESERSTTKAAIGENINIALTNDKNAEKTLSQLNRDTQNANQKVTKHDISEVKETQELVKGIGEVSEKAFQIYTHSAREKVTEAKLELSKAQAQKASKEEISKLEANLDRLQKEFDKNYGTGSKTKLAVDAVTGALQGLAAKDVGQAAVGLASPYLNEQIKKYTEGDTQANLIAHALLGAVEAAATGNNVLAGAAAGAGSEAAADFIAKTLYKGKSTKDLSESEKQTVTFLSQLAGGLASGIIGDSTQSAAVGADIGKRAVENNYLSNWQEQKRSQELKSCHGDARCEDQVRLYWGLVDIGQDVSFVSGAVAGVPENIAESVEGLISMFSSPIETIVAMKELIAREDTLSYIANMTKQEYLAKLDKMQVYYEQAGAVGSFNAGKEFGNMMTDVVTALTGAGALVKTGVGTTAKIVTKSGKEIAIPKTRSSAGLGTCSFHGDMEVKTDKGYRQISSIKVGDKVLAKNERTGITTYQKVQAHYSNPYDYTVYVEVADSKGKYHTIVSNKIHPFFTQVLSGRVPISSEGHSYNGEIAKAQWVDAQHLQKGYRLLAESGEWQTVTKVEIKQERLKAYNMTVEKDHTYFIRGTNADNEGVWVHNDCWHALPNDAKQVKNIDGYKAYQFTDPKDGKVVTVVQKDLNRFETPNHQAGVDPHFNRLSQQIDAETGRYLSTDNPVDGLYNRAYLRSETLQKIYANYEKLPNGNYRDLDGNIIKGPIDIGHAYGWEHRRLSLAAKELNWSQKQFNDYVNARPERFRLENISENRSHKNEMPGKDNIKSIIDDMKKFQQIGK